MRINIRWCFTVKFEFLNFLLIQKKIRLFVNPEVKIAKDCEKAFLYSFELLNVFIVNFSNIHIFIDKKMNYLENKRKGLV